jgi:chaperonin GroES
MKLKPLGDCIIVEQHDEETKTAGGIIIAFDGPNKKFQGTVMACGDGKIMDNGGVRNINVKVGDVVLFGEYAGQKFSYEGKEYLVMHEADIIAKIGN